MLQRVVLTAAVAADPIPWLFIEVNVQELDAGAVAIALFDADFGALPLFFGGLVFVVVDERCEQLVERHFASDQAFAV
ncbi:hypothetical protein D3C78_1785460 [compost metagenome]